MGYVILSAGEGSSPNRRPRLLLVNERRCVYEEDASRSLSMTEQPSPQVLDLNARYPV
jgi:hypothetical protein